MSPRRRELLILGSAATAAGVAGAVIGAFALQSRSGAADLLSAQYPDLSGTVRRVSEWRGRPLVCNFWATWCAPCREEIPLLDAARLEHADKGLEIIGIAVDSAANVREYVKTTPIGYPVLLGDASAIDLMRRLGNAAGGLPFTVMLDEAGRLRERHLGALTAPRLSAELERLLR